MKLRGCLERKIKFSDRPKAPKLPPPAPFHSEGSVLPRKGELLRLLLKIPLADCRSRCRTLPWPLPSPHPSLPRVLLLRSTSFDLPSSSSLLLFAALRFCREKRPQAVFVRLYGAPADTGRD